MVLNHYGPERPGMYYVTQDALTLTAIPPHSASQDYKQKPLLAVL